MRVLGLLGLVIALAIVAILAKNQLGAVGSVRIPVPQTSVMQSQAQAPMPAEDGNVREQSQSLQRQVGQFVDANLQSGTNRLEQAELK